MAEIKLSAEAIEDLKKIKSYIAEELCNETAALHTISKITGSLRRLADFPQSGAPLASIVNLIRIIGTIHAETTPPFIAMKTESFMSPVFYMADETLYGFCLGNPKRTERIGGATAALFLFGA